MSLVEVYNNSVYDLLQDLPESFNSTNKNPQNLTLREEGRRVYVHGAVEIEVKSSDEAVKLYLNGQRRRKVAETLLNTESSRSHCVLSLRLVRAPLYPSAELDTMDPAELVISQFSLVDLAGSERTGRTKNQGSRLKEASNINNSLMSLRMCIEILRENQTTGCNKVVPYRDQRLTYLFRNFFEGDGHVRILACINQSPNEIEETLNVLKFAESSQEVQTTRTPIQPPRSGTPVISRGHERVTNETDIETPKKNSNPCKIHAWNDVVPTELMQCEMAFPLPGTVLLPEDVNHLIQNQRSFLQSRINLKEKSSEIVRRQNDEFRSRLQALVQHDHKAHALHESRIQEALERERNKNSTLLTKLRQLETLLEEKNSAHRQEEADKKRQIDRLRYQIDQLRRVNPRPNPSNRAGSPLEGPGTDEGNSDQQKPPRTPAASHLRNKNIVSSLTRQWENRIVSKESGVRTPINARFTPGKKRRSRSADAIASILPTNKVVWIEHHDPKETPSGTLMTPKIKNRKSVTQLEYKDTLKATNYVLAHQKTDVDGNLQTELFKGDLIPTAGGGTACIFKDVEKLTQRSPLCMETETDSTTKRKRNSSAANTEEWDFLSLKDDCENDAPVSPDTITQRCRLSAGHRRSSNKKSRTALS